VLAEEEEAMLLSTLSGILLLVNPVDYATAWEDRGHWCLLQTCCMSKVVAVVKRTPRPCGVSVVIRLQILLAGATHAAGIACSIPCGKEYTDQQHSWPRLQQKKRNM
jgi:hypothetical protein